MWPWLKKFQLFSFWSNINTMISKILRKIYQTKLPSIFTSEFHSWFFLWFLVFGWQSYSNKHLLSEQCMCLTHDKLLTCWKCHCIFELIFVAFFINLISHDARDSGPYERCAVMHIRGKGYCVIATPQYYILLCCTDTENIFIKI